MQQSLKTLNHYQIMLGVEVYPSTKREIHNDSIILMRNEVDLLPLCLSEQARVAVIYPVCPKAWQFGSVALRPSLAQALQLYHPYVDEYFIFDSPSESQIAVFRQRVEAYDLLVLGTVNASSKPAQAEFVMVMLQTAVPTITIAFGSPNDLAAYPQTTTHIQVETKQLPALQMVAAALWGVTPRVMEVWEDKATHAASLQDERVRALIQEAMPLIDGTSEGNEIYHS